MSGEEELLTALAREALLREHHELFRAGQHAVGVEPLPFERLSERSLRLKHRQMDPLADAAIAPVLAALAAARAELADAHRALDAAREPILRAVGNAINRVASGFDPAEAYIAAHEDISTALAASRSSSSATCAHGRTAWHEVMTSDAESVGCDPSSPATEAVTALLDPRCAICGGPTHSTERHEETA